MPKWLTVARNEYRIRLSRIRKIRSYFPLLVIGLLAVYVAFVAPVFVGVFLDDFLRLLLSQEAVAMVQIVLFSLFVYFMIIPITDTLRQEQTGQLEILLAAPIHPSDVLLGEFLGEMPFYAIFVSIVTGFFTAILEPLGLDWIQKAITIGIFVLTFLCALWIGTVVAAILRTRLGKTARGKDIGRALAMIIALPLVALFYAITYGGLFEVLAGSGASGWVRGLLGLLPSSWGADIIVSFASNPGNVGAVGFKTLTHVGGLSVFFIIALWIGTKIANRAYSLEPITFIAASAKPDGAFYRTVKYVGGGKSFGSLLVSVFKDYGRRLENLSNITYVIGLLVLMNIFIAPTVSTDPSDPPIALMMAYFLFPILVAMVAGGVTVHGKENLFMFRKAPSGVGRLVRARLVQSWLVVIPIVAIITAVTTILSPQPTFISLVTNTGLMVFIVAANVAFTLGLFLLNPPFSVKSVKLWVNIMVIMFASIGLFMISLLVSMICGALSDPVGGILFALLVQIPLNWAVGSAFLYFGQRKLNRVE
jgi:hypothetical protein